MQKQSRTTVQRTVLLQELRSVTTHPTADELYSMTKARLPRISLGTVYRNLDLLVQQGEVVCLDIAGAQKRFDGNVMPHQHVRCSVCGKVADLYEELSLPGIEDVTLDGFTITGVRVEFEGICAECAPESFPKSLYR